MNKTRFEELLLQSLEHERGGVKVYEAAVRCALDPRIVTSWQAYLEETRTHVTTLEEVCRAAGLDPDKETPGRAIVRLVGGTLVQAMEQALAAGDLPAAEVVACECVVLAETKDHADWQLLGKCARELEGEAATALEAAYEEIEDQEDEHLYHSKGWCRELWLQSLGLTPVLPPPEERQNVRTAIGAARAEGAADRERAGERGSARPEL